MESLYENYPPADESLLNRIKENLLHPADSCRRYRDEELGVTFRYYAKVLAASIVFQLIWMLLIGFTGTKGNPLFDSLGVSFDLLFIAMLFLSGVFFVAYLISVFVDGLVTHFGVLIAGGKYDLNKTIQAVIISYIPYLLLPSILLLPAVFIAVILFSTIIPMVFFNYALGILILLVVVMFAWDIVVRVVAIKEIQYLSMPRAIFAALFPLIAILFVVLIFFIPLIVLGGVLAPHGSELDQIGTSNAYNSPGVKSPVDSPLILRSDELPVLVQSHRTNERNLTMYELPAERFGCREMYNVLYSKNPTLSEKTGLIYHDIMLFPQGRAVEMMSAEVDSYKPDSSGVPERLSCPDLGDANSCFRTVMTDVKTGKESDSYVIIFRKGDIVEKLWTLGPDPDFNLVKDIAVRSAAKIPEPDRMTPMMTPPNVPAVVSPSGTLSVVSYNTPFSVGITPTKSRPGAYVEPTGTVTFTSVDPPNVKIRFENIYRGETPLILKDIPIGQYSLYASKDGYVPLHQFYSVGPNGGSRTMEIQLNKM